MFGTLVSRSLRRCPPPTVRGLAAAALFAAVLGGCGGTTTAPIFDPPPAQLKLRWVSMAPGSCTGVVTNVGGLTAQDVSVFLYYYSAAEGDTALGTHIGSVAGGASVVVTAAPQVTRGEPRFPDLAGFSYAGAYHHGGWGGRPPLHVAYYSYPCLVGPDSARVWVRNDYYGYAGLAFHVILNVETPAGVAQIPLRQTAVGPICGTECASGGAQGCDGWGNFHLAVRDSAGIKLLPRILSMHWENGAGVPDSLVMPDPYYGYDSGQYGVSAHCPL